LNNYYVRGIHGGMFSWKTKSIHWKRTEMYIYEISGSHGGEYEYDSFLEHIAM
jgi:hypothetical protein